VSDNFEECREAVLSVLQILLVNLIAQDAPLLALARFFAFFGANVNTVLIALQSFAMIGVPLLLPLISEVRLGDWCFYVPYHVLVSRNYYPVLLTVSIALTLFFFLRPHMRRCRTQ